ncbi:MAG: hypothetical protein HOP96_12390 [Sphingomonas sp.]|nr:hypothetical protein [Sphingomonas sp.]
MGRRVKDFIEISEYTSLDQLINTLSAIRDSLPTEAEPELRMKGDDVFGRRLSISYFRELTEEEATLDRRYSGSDLPAPDAEIEDLRHQLDNVEFEREDRVAKRRIRRVA